MESLVDLIFVSATLGSIVPWEVSEDYNRNGDQANCLKIKGESSTTEAWNDTMSNGETAKSRLFESHVFRPGRLWCFPYYREE